MTLAGRTCMANQEHLDVLKPEMWNQWRQEHADPEQYGILKQGAEMWNQWRRKHPGVRAHLRGANLYGADLRDADLSNVNFHKADLRGVNLSRACLTRSFFGEADLTTADLSGANLNTACFNRASLLGANLNGADLSDTDLSETDLREAYLIGANLTRTNLMEANLSRANLTSADLRQACLVRAVLVGTNLTRASLTQCFIYGISAWSVELGGATQDGLVITSVDEPTITVDNLRVAQFIYLLLNNAEIRDVIDTITSKVVLILGRFTPERKIVLDTLREELRKHNYSPVLFDFEKPASRDLTETISTLAHLARFIVVDLTDPSSAPHEVATVIPHTVVPVQPLLSHEPIVIDGKEVERRAYSMFKDLQRRYHWVLPIYSYTDQTHLLATLQEHVIVPAEQKAQELAKR